MILPSTNLSPLRKLLAHFSSHGFLPLTRANFSVFLTGAIFLLGLNSHTNADPVPVGVQKFEGWTKLKLEREIPGLIESRLHGPISSQRDGLAMEVRFEQGDKISKGQILVVQDTSSFALQLKQLQEKLNQAQAILDQLEEGTRKEDLEIAKSIHQASLSKRKLARLKLDRVIQARNEVSSSFSRETQDELETQWEIEKFQSESESWSYEKAKKGPRDFQITAQRAEVQSVEAQILSMKLEISKRTIRAPYDGVALTKAVQPGMMLQPGSPVTDLMNLKHLQVRFLIPLNLDPATLIANGVKIHRSSNPSDSEISFDQNGVKILPNINLESRSQELLIPFDGTENPAKPGEEVRLIWHWDREELGLWLPVHALNSQTRGLWSVQIAKDEEKVTVAVPKLVRVLAHKKDLAFVHGPISMGDRIIVEGNHFLAPGSQVRVSKEITR